MISTKTGDEGMTGTGNGERVRKDSPVIEAVGMLDELNSWLGLSVCAITHRELEQEKEVLISFQNTLFHIGAEIVGSPLTVLSEDSVTHIEAAADRLQERLSSNWHKNFVLPGGTEAAARVDVSRTICRKCERALVRVQAHQKMRLEILKYINRMSDYLYLLRCYINEVLNFQEQLFVRAEKSQKK